MSSTLLEARLLQHNAVRAHAYAEIAAILDCMVHNCPLIYWLLIFNCSIITYFIPVSLEKLPCFKAFFIEFMYTLNHTALN